MGFSWDRTRGSEWGSHMNSVTRGMMRFSCDHCTRSVRGLI